MRSSEVVALMLLVGGIGVGYLVYTKKIKLPEFDLISGGGDTKSEKESSEEDTIVKDLQNDAPKPKIDIPIPKDFLSDALKRGQDILDVPKDFLSDALKRGQDILGSSTKKPITTTTTTTSTSSSSKSIDEMIRDALRGHGFRPFPGTAGRPDFD